VRDQKKSRALINALPDMIVEVTRFGVIIDCKRRQSRELAQTEVASIGQPLDTVMPPAAAEQALGHVLVALDEQAPQEFTYREETGDDWRAFEGRIVALNDVEAIIIVRDVTDQQRVLADMARAREAALEASRVKGEFLATMSHELRTPMNGVLGMTDVLLFSSLDEQQREAAQTIRRCGQNLLEHINEILQFSALDSGRVELHPMPTDVGEVLDDVGKLLKVEADKRRITLAINREGDGGQALVDATKIRQVITNLIGNALKFTDRGGVTATLTSTRTGDAVALRLTVADTGIGIPAEKLDRIFERFTQADSSTSRRYGGTGLGLAITKGLVELMGGELEVDSRIGEGSTFTVSFQAPAVGDATTKARERTSPPAAAPGDGLTVLLVEDNHVNQLVARRLLVGLGCEVDTAVNGQVALDCLDARAYDLVVMDCDMPVMDGYEATEHIRAHEDPAIRGLRVVALTANVQDDNRERCRAVGMDDFLTKPVQRAALKVALEEAQSHLAPRPSPPGAAASVAPRSPTPPRASEAAVPAG
jgi:signal transduction histidine kinase/DNA-binding NarL/FixJ family response regulator